MNNTITITLTQEEFGAMAYAVNNEYYRMFKRRVLMEDTKKEARKVERNLMKLNDRFADILVEAE